MVFLFPAHFLSLRGWGRRRIKHSLILPPAPDLALSAIPSLPTHLYRLAPAPCGGAVRNATVGRVLSPSHSANASGSQFCVWTIEAPEGQKLHLHFERLALHEKDR